MTRIRFLEPPKRNKATAKETLRLLVAYGLATLLLWAVFYKAPAKADDGFNHPQGSSLVGRAGSMIRSTAAVEAAAEVRLGIACRLRPPLQGVAVSGFTCKEFIHHDQ